MGWWRKLIGTVTGDKIPGVPSRPRAIEVVTGEPDSSNRGTIALQHAFLDLLQSEPGRFTSRVVNGVEAVQPGDLIDGRPVGFYGIRVKFDDGPALINISKIYLNVRHHLTKADIPRLLTHHMRAHESTFESNSWDQAAEHLLPRLAPQPHPQIAGVDWGDLHVWLVIDEPTRMTYVSRDRLAGWGPTVQEALDVSLANLRVRYAGVRPMRLPQAQTGRLSIWGVTCDPDYSATLVLLPEIVERVPLTRDEMYVIVPQRDRLFFAERPERAEDRLFLLQSAFNMFVNGGYRISPFLFKWVGNCLGVVTAQEIADGSFGPDEEGRFVLLDPRDNKPILLRVPQCDFQTRGSDQHQTG